MCGKGIHRVISDDAGTRCYIDYFCDLVPCGGWGIKGKFFDEPRCPHNGYGTGECTCVPDVDYNYYDDNYYDNSG